MRHPSKKPLVRIFCDPHLGPEEYLVTKESDSIEKEEKKSAKQTYFRFSDKLNKQARMLHKFSYYEY